MYDSYMYNDPDSLFTEAIRDLAYGMCMQDSPVFMEAEKMGFFQRAKEKIIKAFAIIRERIAKLLGSKSAKQTEEAINKIKGDPNLKNTKVKMKDYESLEKLDEETLKALRDPKSNPTAIMEQRKQKKKKILAAAGIILSATAVIGSYFALKKSNTKDLQEYEATAVKSVENCEKEKLKEQTGNTGSVPDSTQQRADSIIQVCADASKLRAEKYEQLLHQLNMLEKEYRGKDEYYRTKVAEGESWSNQQSNAEKKQKEYEDKAKSGWAYSARRNRSTASEYRVSANEYRRNAEDAYHTADRAMRARDKTERKIKAVKKQIEDFENN